MSFDVHPILDPGHLPARNTWYAIAPEGKEPGQNTGPCPRVGACANFIQSGEGVGRVLVSAGATPEGPFSDLHQLTLEKGEAFLFFHPAFHLLHTKNSELLPLYYIEATSKCPALYYGASPVSRDHLSIQATCGLCPNHLYS